MNLCFVLTIMVVNASTDVDHMGFKELLNLGTYALNNLTAIPDVSSNKHLHDLQQVLQAV